MRRDVSLRTSRKGGNMDIKQFLDTELAKYEEERKEFLQRHEEIMSGCEEIIQDMRK